MAPWWNGCPVPTGRNAPRRAPGVTDTEDERDPADERIAWVSTSLSIWRSATPLVIFRRIVGIGLYDARRDLAYFDP